MSLMVLRERSLAWPRMKSSRLRPRLISVRYMRICIFWPKKMKRMKKTVMNTCMICPMGPPTSPSNWSVETDANKSAPNLHWPIARLPIINVDSEEILRVTASLVLNPMANFLSIPGRVTCSRVGSGTYVLLKETVLGLDLQPLAYTSENGRKCPGQNRVSTRRFSVTVRSSTLRGLEPRSLRKLEGRRKFGSNRRALAREAGRVGLGPED